MNSIKLLFGGIMVLALSLVVWSCKDDFTERDLLNTQRKNDSLAAVLAKKLATDKDSIALSIQVYNASTTAIAAGGRSAATEALAGIAVSVTADGKKKTGTTDADGTVTMYVQPGTVSGTLKGTGFTTVNFVLSVTQQNGTTGQTLTNAATTLPVFATTGATVAKVSGTATAETNLLNNTREPAPDGVTITFSPNLTTTFVDASGLNSTAVDIDKITIDGVFIATTTGGTGAFSVDLPTAVDGLVYTYTYSDFTADQSIAIDRYEGDPAGSVRAAVTIPTRFVSNALPSNNFTAVPAVSPNQVDIADPPAAGTGAAITVSLLPQSVAPGGLSVVASGSGYPVSTTVPVTVTGGDFDAAVAGSLAAALVANTDANGKVTSITGTVGFGYRSQPTLTIGGSGTGAVGKATYTSTLAPLFGTNALTTSGSALTAGGSGYEIAPNLIVRGYDASGNYIEGVSTGVTVSPTGAVVNATMPGTTFTRLLAATPAIFRPVSRLAAIADAADFNTANVNALGEITLPASTTGVGLTGTATVQGTGYSLVTPPAVTVRGLRGGSGAVVGADLSGGGINYLYTVARGSGYSSLANANLPTTSTGTSFSTTGSITSGTTALRPGMSYTLYPYYGTGIKTKGVQ